MSLTVRKRNARRHPVSGERGNAFIRSAIAEVVLSFRACLPPRGGHSSHQSEA